jgi:hypothetical protein
MSIDNFYPSLGRLLEIEDEFIKRAGTCEALARFPHLISELQSLRGEVEGSGLNFKSHITFEDYADEYSLLVIIGGLITANEESSYGQNSYKVLIIDEIRERVLRCVHYDFEPSEYRSEGEIKPSMHLQIGGKIAPLLSYAQEFTDFDLSEDNFDNTSYSFEKIRVAFYPVTLISILNSIFLEFANLEKVESVVSTQEWKAIVRDLEIELLSGYFNHGCEHLNGSPAETPLSYTYYNLE